MKTKSELNALKKEVETLNQKLAELSDDELETVTGGIRPAGIETLLPIISARILLSGTSLLGSTTPQGTTQTDPSLQSAPSLPASTLAEDRYDNMTETKN